jgi:type VII secretion protein EccB
MTMQSRRDLFQAHRLMTQRASLALLRGEPDVPDQPLRRLNVAVFSGLFVAVIITGLIFILGLLGHGSSSIQNTPGMLVIDKQTGTPFVFCEGKKLCPVVNYASARLALGASPLNQQTVDQSALTKFPRGPEIGIPGLPQPLPAPTLLVRQPWSVCTQTTTSPFGTHTATALVGGTSVGGRPLGNDALLVTAQKQDWVIWNGQRMPIQRNIIQALRTPSTPVVTSVAVPPVWLNALPQGPGFTAPAIAGKGATVPGPAGGSVLVGQVYQVSSPSGTQYDVMLRDGLAAISPMQAALLESEPGAPPRATLTPGQVTSHQSAVQVPRGGLPTSVPTVVTPAASAPMCVVYSGAGTAATGTALAAQVETGGTLPSGGFRTGAANDVGQITLPPGSGALVGADPSTGSDSGVVSYFLIAGGRRYALASTAVIGMLGYDRSQAVLLPAGVVDLVPAGAALDPTLARRTVPASG